MQIFLETYEIPIFKVNVSAFVSKEQCLKKVLRFMIPIATGIAVVMVYKSSDVSG